MAHPQLAKFKRLLIASKHVGIDSMCFIYQLSESSRYLPLTDIIFSLTSQKKIQLTTSIISLIETLAKPEELGEKLVVHQYQEVFTNLTNLDVIPVDLPVAQLTASLRGKYKHLEIPDTIQLAVALLKDCKVFITNDKQLTQVKEIKVKLLQEYI